MRYHKLGAVPRERHTVYRNPSNGRIFYEELFGTLGFSGTYSLLYHYNRPTRIKEILSEESIKINFIKEIDVKPRLFSTMKILPADDYIKSRRYLLGNNDILIAISAPRKWTNETFYLYKNALADELLFVHKGKGVFHSMFGTIKFSVGDYIVIPRGTIYNIEFETEDNHLLIVESYSHITIPKRYRNEHGQILEHAPYYERNFRLPEELEKIRTDEAIIKIKKGSKVFTMLYETHPYDIVGWDGYAYPYAFSIYEFSPIVGKLHMPPPIHQTFEGIGFVVCSFCPRLFDFHPQAIPLPYHHSNVDSDEILYYFAGEFMSRKGITEGDITLHPIGIPHGPQPNLIEKSIGAKETNEYAVMIDTFNPLSISEEALKIENPNYYLSWAENLVEKKV